MNLEKGEMNNVDWTQLPSELLLQIIENQKHMLSVDDYVSMSSVCRSWRKALSSRDIGRLKQIWSRNMPWLMLTDGNKEIINQDLSNHPRLMSMISDNDARRKRSIMNLRYGKTYKVSCPQGYGRSCWGSAHGWILSHDIVNYNMYLFNPLTKARLDLPPTSTMPDVVGCFDVYFIYAASILKMQPPSDNDQTTLLVVVLIYQGESIAFAKPGDSEWKAIESSDPGLSEVVLYRQNNGCCRLLVLSNCGDLGYCDLLEGKTVTETDLRLTWYGCELGETLTDDQASIEYLVQSGEDLLMVSRIFEIDKTRQHFDYYRTVDFEVYKFRFDDKRWEELQELQDVALFLGNNASMSVCATDVGCERNCVYFTDDVSAHYSKTTYQLGGHDMGIFRLHDKTIRPLDVGDHTHTRSSYCCPFWFCPAL